MLSPACPPFVMLIFTSCERDMLWLQDEVAQHTERLVVLVASRMELIASAEDMNLRTCHSIKALEVSVAV